MQEDPVRYWQDLTDNYRQMSDGELLELAAKPEDLTDVAQQVLRDEMRSRGLNQTKPELEAARTKNTDAKIRWEPTSYRYEFAHSEPGGEEGPHEYTWKTKLCDCETRLQALQLAAALQRAGIDSWIQASRASADMMEITYPRVLVAADQLEQAEAVVGQPIPQDIIDESIKDQEPQPQNFDLPVCPECGAPDPVLCANPDVGEGGRKPDDSDWVNSWFCEACGAEWTDPETGANEAE